LRRLETGLEGRVVRGADVVVCASRPVAADLERRFHVRAEVVANGWDPAVAPPGVEPPRHDVRTLVHTGTLSGTFGRNPEPLLRALAALRKEPGVPPLRFLHAGRLTAADLALLGRSGAAEAFEHVGTLDRATALALQRSADALVLVTARNVGELPGKLFEYLAAGRPIVALAAGNEAARVVEETRTGVAVAPDDVGGDRNGTPPRRDRRDRPRLRPARPGAVHLSRTGEAHGGTGRVRTRTQSGTDVRSDLVRVAVSGAAASPRSRRCCR
jgi:glycosyltransferase involved in cell wall biosynthesis